MTVLAGRGDLPLINILDRFPDGRWPGGGRNPVFGRMKSPRAGGPVKTQSGCRFELIKPDRHVEMPSPAYLDHIELK